MHSQKPGGISLKRIVTWLVLLAVVLAILKFAPRAGLHELRQNLPGNAPKLTVLDIACIPDPAMPRAEVRVRNTGKKVVVAPTGDIHFAAETLSGRFVPDSIQPGAYAKMTVYATTSNVGNCELLGIADAQGRKASLENMARFRNPRDLILQP